MGAYGTLSSVRTLLVQTNRQTDGHIYCSDTFLQTNRQTDGQTVLRNYYIDWKVYKVERALASSIFELNPPKFQNYYNFENVTISKQDLLSKQAGILGKF